MNNWFYSNDGTTRHEVDPQAFARLVREGIVTPDTLVWREGLADWQPARLGAPELFASAPAPGGFAPMPAGSEASAPSVSIELPPPPPPPGPSYAPPTPAGVGAFPPVQPRDSNAMTSCILGSSGLACVLFGICCCLGPLGSIILGVLAVVMGHPALKRAKQPDGNPQDGTLAMVGLITGYLSLVLGIGYFVLHIALVGVAGMAEAAKGGFSP